MFKSTREPFTTRVAGKEYELAVRLLEQGSHGYLSTEFIRQVSHASFNSI
jgi:hypothetical protein